MAGSLAVGLWVDRARRWRLIALGLLVWTAASAAAALADSAPALFAARASVAFGQAVLAPAALSLLLQGPGDGADGRRIGAFVSGASVGRSVALVAGGGLLAALPTLTLGAADPETAWRWLFVITALPNLALAALLFARREPPALGAFAEPQPAFRAPLRPSADGPVKLAVLATASCCLLLTQSLGQWAPSLLARVGGLCAGSASALFGAVVVVAAPAGAWLGGALADAARRRGVSPLAGVGASLLAAALAGVGLGLGRGLPTLVVALFATTLTAGAAAVAALASWQTLASPGVRGAETALYFAATTALGLGLGPPLVGAVSDLAASGGSGLQAALSAVTVAVAAPAGAFSLLLAKLAAADSRRV